MGFALLLLMTGASLSGCVERADETREDAHEFPPLGLDLQVPHSLPLPGRFAEDSDLASFAAFLVVEGGKILAECGNSNGGERVRLYLDRQDFHNAIHYLFYGCEGDESRAYAELAISESQERATYDLLRAEALSAYEEARRRLNELPGPGTRTEAQYISYLMVRNIWDHLRIERAAPLVWNPYEDGSARDRLQLQNAYLQLLNARGGSENIMKIIERYPWTSPSCIAPDLDGLLYRIDRSVNRTLALARGHGHDDVDVPLEGVHFHYTWVRDWLLPDLELARRDGWWPRLLALEVHFESWVSYWESFSAPAWPTLEEAEYLLALFRNESRSIFAEQAIEPHLVYFEERRSDGELGWRRAVDPPQVLRLMALRWPWAELDCPGSAG
jgi:hypothetical protein